MGLDLYDYSHILLPITCGLLNPLMSDNFSIRIPIELAFNTSASVLISFIIYNPSWLPNFLRYSAYVNALILVHFVFNFLMFIVSLVVDVGIEHWRGIFVVVSILILFLYTIVDKTDEVENLRQDNTENTNRKVSGVNSRLNWRFMLKWSS